MRNRIKDIVITLGAMVSFYLSFEYQELIIYVKCRVSTSEAEFQIRCEWCKKEFAEIISYSYIEDKYKRLHPAGQDNNWWVVHNVLDIIKEKIGKEMLFSI